MWILGIETSGFDGEIALLEDGIVVEERSLTHQGRRHAQSLVKQVAEALQTRNLQPNDIDVVGVSIGPGSFTGLRVGVVFAKTWCYATGCRLVAVDTMQAVAENSPAEVKRVSVIADAQRGELFVGHYRREENGNFARIGEITIVPATTYAERCQLGDFITGPGLQRFENLFADGSRIAPPEIRIPKAAVIADLAGRSAEAGRFADLWSLEPFYLRKSAAEEKADRANAR